MAEKISKLTKAQEGLLEVYREKWTKIGLSTEQATFEQALEYARKLYTQLLEKPKPLVFLLKSPLQAWTAVSIAASDKLEEVLGYDLKQMRENNDKAQKDLQSILESESFDPKKYNEEQIVWPYSDGTNWSGWAAFYDYMETVLKIELPPIWHIWKDQVQFSLLWCLDDICVISQHPIEINMVNGLLHADGKPSIKYSDGFSCWSLNGVAVPQWLSETSIDQIDVHRITELTNAEVRREFVRKVGLEIIYSQLNGRIIDEKTVFLDTPEEKNWPCHYKLVELNFGNNTLRRVLEMPNASLHEMWHVEYVTETCNTIEEAMNFRLGRLESDVDDDIGSSWWLQGDVIIEPKGEKKLKRWPDMIS
uniref:DUF6745 domain-containing protein n=1 Tax=viral metagenome TaxID=1070528 RepID=A0A6M3KV25_9ZZZZ